MFSARPDIRRLARRGGVYRIKKEIYDDIRHVLKIRLTEVVYALKRMGTTLYGFEEQTQ
ncbi:hypothetical protein BJY04DRAFT_212520 [Aspergillus karnatakaensis]|uniref:uncharacterized protein n=1 Tax=Aspergillus karnatakaensis TaxID=1810916 RepID=UPI003CCDA543